ncbi:spore germination protein GerPC [Fictibacillus macauensis ZFHKF-1]|uniref:Spore germination protein GerPC n=1 Tax=Fictibacillus macauensis ZFHKF-1 TaxID=1196324 RepID=I8UCQ9_9BACL|nr:germination protein GerPC [Fictibacillus macauensis]EIT84710.1 spore germination protein GerPC [Fictibacillus macauensis ZFHKF-1]
MPDTYDQYYLIQQMQGQLQCLNDKVCMLEKKLSDVTEQLKKIQSQPATQIQYSFDQLKIERLDGTLNIGLSGSDQNGKDLVEDFTVGGESIMTGQREELEITTLHEYKDILHALEHYLTAEVAIDIQKIENEHQYRLDSTYHELMVNDIRQQLPKRLQHYLVKYPPKTNEEVLFVENKVKGDIYKGMEHFLMGLKRNAIGGDLNEVRSDQPRDEGS